MYRGRRRWRNRDSERGTKVQSTRVQARFRGVAVGRSVRRIRSEVGEKRQLGCRSPNGPASEGGLLHEKGKGQRRRRRQLQLLELGVTFDEFFGAAAGKGDGKAAIVVIAFDADDGADAVFRVTDSSAEQRICICAAA